MTAVPTLATAGSVGHDDNVAAPYSQCDARGRCIRHPTIQMSRKKKLGGWKKLLGICPMCAMELMAAEGDNAVSADAFCEDGQGRHSSRRVSQPDAASVHSGHYHHGQPAKRPSRSRPHVSRDDVSVEQSVRSAPSTVHRHPPRHHRPSHRGHPASPHGYPTKGHYSGHSSDSSCDTTVEMSSSESSLGSHRSPLMRPQVGHVDPHAHPQQAAEEEQFVCGMPFDGMFYTGQIHAESRLPHGLGTLRSECGSRMDEGEWHYGRLVNPQQDYADDYPQDEGNHYEDDLSRKFANSLNCTDSLAGTDDGSHSSDEWSGSHASSSLSSYSARESKSPLPSSGHHSSRSSGARASQRKVREFERYIEHCDAEEDYYQDSSFRGSHHSQGSRDSGEERVRRVRFREDP